MKRTFKILVSTLLLFITSLSLVSYSFEDIQIHLDSSYTNEMPAHFRKSSDVSLLGDTDINTTGLDKLNISGSSQFTAFNLPLLIQAIDTNLNIVDFDLREESHGFINGMAISFHNAEMNLNNGLSVEQVIEAEFNHLKSIKLNQPITFYNTNTSITPNNVNNEKFLTESKKLSYERLPVKDGDTPNETVTANFVNLVKNQPENTWFHFHCRAGIGRTTTFMIMYDSMKNCNDVSLHDIIARQVLLSKMSESDAVMFYTGKHYDFLSTFYDKCKNNNL